MNISEMNKRILIKKEIVKTDKYGIENKEKILICRVWSKLENITYKVINKNQDERFIETYSFIIRKRKDLDNYIPEELEVECETKLYKVLSIKIYKKMYQEIIARRFTDE